MFAENVASKLIGLVTTVLILGAVYLFIIKPVLDTTNNAFDSVNSTINNSFDEFGLDGVSISDISKGDFGKVQRQIEKGLNGPEQRRAERLLDCVQRVQPDTSKMQRCAERFQ